MLHSNMIVDIEDNTFQDLTSLQVNPFSPLAFGQNSLTSRILVCDTLLLRMGCILEILSCIVERPSVQGARCILIYTTLIYA